ncbi:efflux RND transporter periplasmic adaptor subunit [Albidovulum sp.]|uniref:efflux RND transporter periplasmic adaptor subunit n=1 Tax=Albidovulum sp. TaxID=1872424 RepID=UPI002B633E51|nr:HlyD family efflux transporter periplasmic adaptor subunit [Defluviimonas sp.]MCO5126160.1 efflux transporter periplasmic adaptor subunit [Paracoccaceae bacterium]HPE27054.1 efflux transporter periplasmic adaptor subunit [Albidovulum sp.]MCP5356372.1 HlyD family efflux transporter periplasmic adaptor subunit [Paracoccaceae bacterium]MCP5375574.1 HlyD family efflux transporter periplasmic adaptor subunit [Paracoccaceae bacterium]
MRFLFRSLLGLVHLIAVVALLAAAGLWLRAAVESRQAGPMSAGGARERVFASNVVTLEPRTIAPVLGAYGTVRSRRTLELRAAAEGTVVEINPSFVEGGAVSAGDVLVRFDPRDAEAARDLAVSDRDAARLEKGEAERALVLARDDLAAAEVQADLRDKAQARLEDLATKGLGTAADREAAALAASSAIQGVLTRRQSLAEAEARLDRAVSAVSRAEITLAEAERRVADTILRAEFSGVLAGVSVVEGGLVGRNEKLGDLIDPEALEVAFRISTGEFASFLDEAGALLPLRVRVEFAAMSAEGRIERAGAAVAAGESGRQVFAVLDRAEGLKPGDFVSVFVTEPELHGVAEIPAAALGPDGSVLLVGAEDRLETGQLTVLRRQGDTVIVSLGDLAGREIVAGRTPLLGPGIRIRPVREGAAEEASMIPLTPERRAALVAIVEGSARMPEDAKARVLAELGRDLVPAETVRRLEARNGG